MGAFGTTERRFGRYNSLFWVSTSKKWAVKESHFRITDTQLKKISSIARKELPKRGISIESANALFEDFETLRIPHIGKSDHFKYEDLLDLKYDAFEVTNMKHPNYVSILKKGLVSSTVSFSDTHVWTNYPQQGFLITEINLEKPCFDELKEFLELHRVYSKERA